jgi:hypothetical protein
VVEGASLESLYMGNCIVGSNPILSAIKPKRLLRFFCFQKRVESSLSKALRKQKNASLAKAEVIGQETQKRIITSHSAKRQQSSKPYPDTQSLSVR